MRAIIGNIFWITDVVGDIFLIIVVILAGVFVLDRVWTWWQGNAWRRRKGNRPDS